MRRRKREDEQRVIVYKLREPRWLEVRGEFVDPIHITCVAPEVRKQEAQLVATGEDRSYWLGEIWVRYDNEAMGTGRSLVLQGTFATEAEAQAWADSERVRVQRLVEERTR